MVYHITRLNSELAMGSQVFCIRRLGKNNEKHLYKVMPGPLLSYVGLQVS